jgi:hypothetical protein
MFTRFTRMLNRNKDTVVQQTKALQGGSGSKQKLDIQAPEFTNFEEQLKKIKELH